MALPSVQTVTGSFGREKGGKWALEAQPHFSRLANDFGRNYSNAIPILVSVRQIVRHRWCMPSMMTSKCAGMPKLVDTCNAAPVSERFLTVHSSLGALSLMTIKAAFNTRRRGALRLSFTGSSGIDDTPSVSGPFNASH